MIISPFSILITSISSISWGVFDGIRKHLIQRLNHWTLLLYLSLLFSTSFLIWIVLTNSFELDSGYYLYGFITIVLNFFANYFYIKAIEVSDISSVVPFLAFTSLFTALSSYLVLGEQLAKIQILGIFVVVISSFFINYKSGSSIKKLFKFNKGALLMILVSLLWAISAPFDKLAVTHSNAISHSFIQSIFISFLNLIMVLRFSKEKLFSDFLKAPRALIAGSIIASIALGLQFYAYTLMQVSIFESLKRGLAIITAFIISSIFFKEKISLIKIIATLFLIMGAALILNGRI
jgi:drug/metabolite transporter (DMT)-like permease